MDILAFLSFDSVVFQLVIALFLGLFIGLRREIEIQKEGSESFVGIRTMPLIVLIGTASTLFPTMPYLPVICLIGVLVFLGIAYYNGVFNLHLIGLTSEFSTVIMFLAGIFVGFGEYITAILLTVLVALLTGFKQQLHLFAKGISVQEWRGALQLLIISAVVLPFLPTTAIDPWGVLVPFEIWLLVIFISLIGFVGYFFNKYLGSEKSILGTSILGSLVSSTAVTVALALQAKKNKSIATHIFVLALLFAIATMLVRTILAILVVAHAGMKMVAVIPFCMLVAAILAIAWEYRSHNTDESVDIDPELSSPFELLPALKFGLVFVVVLLAVTLGKEYFGDLGVVAVATVSALIDVDAALLSALQAEHVGEIGQSIAYVAITIAIVINTFVKLGYIAFLSRADVTRKVGLYITLISLVGILGYFAVLG